jgi:hypothetical protein
MRASFEGAGRCLMAAREVVSCVRQQENDVKFKLRTVRWMGVVAADAGDATTSAASVTTSAAAPCDPRTRWIARASGCM